jgi:hypothetical protein
MIEVLRELLPEAVAAVATGVGALIGFAAERLTWRGYRD